MYTGINQRQHDRYDAESFSVYVKDLGTGSFNNFDKVIPVDFNRFGVGFESTQKFETSDELEIKCTSRRRHIAGIIGYICYCEEYDENYRYGVYFDFYVNDYMQSREVKTTLKSMELSLTDSYEPMNRNAYRRIKSNR